MEMACRNTFRTYLLYVRVVVLGSVIVSVFMQMRQIKMRVHSFHVLKEPPPPESDYSSTEKHAQAIPNYP